MAISGRSRFVFGTLAALTAIFASCASGPIYRAYPGAEKAASDVSVFRFVAPAFISIIPYKIDGRAHLDDGDRRFMEGTYYSFTTLSSEWAFEPGEHVIEFYTVDTDPIGQIQVRLRMEAGKTYVMKGTSKKFAITCDDAAVDFTVLPVPVLDEPGENEPHATLSFIPQKSAFKAVPYLFRIDGKARKIMYRLHPRWTTMNYSSLARGIVTSISLSGMLVQPNLDAQEGYFSIRIAPGRHQVEYFADTLFAGQRKFGKYVRVAEFDAEAGKDYLIELVPDAQKAPSGLLENGIRIIRN